MEHEIQITPEHLENGCRCDAGSCPLALAIKDELRLSRVSVGQGRVTFLNGLSRRLPPEAVKFQEDFDAYQYVPLLKFKLSV